MKRKRPTIAELRRAACRAFRKDAEIHLTNWGALQIYRQPGLFFIESDGDTTAERLFLLGGLKELAKGGAGE